MDLQSTLDEASVLYIFLRKSFLLEDVMLSLRLLFAPVAVSCLLAIPSLATETKAAKKPDAKGKPMIAIFDTTEGKFKVKLFADKAPKTVANFVGLAQGSKEWTDPKSGAKVKKPFYDGLIFHRVIPDFMIQGGCPIGQGTGDAGYKFDDEFGPGLKHDKPGMLSMANAGPNTNGSQFFVTVAATPWLDGKHAIFGEVVEGMDIVTKISLVKTGSQNRPATPVKINKVTID
jgi:peptidyl-prolyl cis-trans isomerase A (cyclophilin A)